MGVVWLQNNVIKCQIEQGGSKISQKKCHILFELPLNTDLNISLLMGQPHEIVCVLFPGHVEPVPQGAGFVQVLVNTWEPLQFVVFPQLLQGPAVQSDQFPSIKWIRY